jgi:hypothetical protein
VTPAEFAAAMQRLSDRVPELGRSATVAMRDRHIVEAGPLTPVVSGEFRDSGRKAEFRGASGGAAIWERTAPHATIIGWLGRKRIADARSTHAAWRRGELGGKKRTRMIGSKKAKRGVDRMALQRVRRAAPEILERMIRQLETGGAG